MKILLAVDGSVYTKRMLAFLAAHDELLGPGHEYAVVHGVPAVPGRAVATVGAKLLNDYYEGVAEEVFKPIRAFLAQKGMSARFVHTVGHPADAIAGLAEEGRFDLVVMGSRGDSDLANLLLGSVATRVLAKCAVPVLLIR